MADSSSMFDSESQRLAWLIGEVEERASSGTSPAIAPSDVSLLLVTTSMVEVALQYTKAIHALITAGLHLAAGPIERGLWELWNDFRYLLMTPDPERQALKVLINASMEVRDFIGKNRPDDRTSQMSIERGLESYRGEDPDLFEEVLLQRKKRRFHWSGLSFTEVARAVSGDTRVYKILSWDAHNLLAPIRDVQFLNAGSQVKLIFSRRDDAFANRDRLAWATGGVLFNMWNDHASRWNGSPISPP